MYTYQLAMITCNGRQTETDVSFVQQELNVLSKIQLCVYRDTKKAKCIIVHHMLESHVEVRGQTLLLRGPEKTHARKKVVSLKSSNALEGFSSPIIALISLHSSKTNRKKKKMTVGSQLSTNDASGLEV